MIKLIVKNADGAQSVYQVEVTVQPEQETMAPESGQNVPPGINSPATQQQNHRWMHLRRKCALKNSACNIL